jgi:Ca2+-binding EF-hand superfamily protein
MFKLMKILKDRTITYDELFRMCDTNMDGELSLQELITCLTSLSPEFF